MRVWLAGSRTFGELVYTALLKIEDVEILVVTAPQDDSLWELAGEYETPRCHEVYPDWVRRYGVDLIVSAQNYAYIGSEAREAATFGAVGYHPSLLPRHRGRRAVEATIEAGDPVAGGTVYLMDDGWDTGPIIAQEWCWVPPGWSASDLWRERLFPLGIELLEQTVRRATGPNWFVTEAQPWPLLPQDEAVATTC